MSVRNETEIQLLKILFKTQKKKPTKNLTSRRRYPHGIEQKYYRELKGFFKPLTDYVQKYINENSESLLHGDSKEIKLDEIPGPSYRKMIYSLEDWLSIYMPDIADLPSDSNNNLIFLALGKTANETMEFGEKEFERIIEQGIHVNMPTSASWWEDMKNSWMEDNYTLITSNAKNYISKINTLTEQAIVNGLSMNKLKDEIQKATESLSDKHCKLLARDQIGKLNGQINQAQMQEVGLDLYVWSTAYDDRVRESHSIMEGLLCRWDDANVCSYDNGKTWVDRPSGAVLLHPGQDIQCRCVGLAFYPELIAEMEGTSIQMQLGSDTLPVQDLPQFSEKDEVESLTKNFIKEGVNTLDSSFRTYIDSVFQATELNYCKVMNKVIQEKPKSINYIPSPKTSAFSPKTKSVTLTHLNYEGTLRHEMGHFFDNMIGFDAKLYWKYDPTYTTSYHFSFSKTKEFSEVYLKELKTMTHEIKKDMKKMFKSGELFPSTSYLLRKELVSFDIEQYLKTKGYNLSNRELLTIQDMFTASTKKNFGGHPASYFIDTRRVSAYPELKDEYVFLEGFAELLEHIYDKNISSGMKKFIDDWFSESIPIIKMKVKSYIS